jgi:hypothetical protein
VSFASPSPNTKFRCLLRHHTILQHITTNNITTNIMSDQYRASDSGSLSKGLGGLFEALPPLDVGDDRDDRHESLGDMRIASTEVNLSMPSTTKGQQAQMLQFAGGHVLYPPPAHPHVGVLGAGPTMVSLPSVVTPTGAAQTAVLFTGPAQYALSSSHDSMNKSGTPTNADTNRMRRAMPRDPVAAAVFNARRAPPTMKSLFISNLHESTEFNELEDIFKRYGDLISCRVLRDAKTGLSRRIGYVNFTSSEAAQRALSELDSKPGPHGAPFVLQFADDDPSFKPEPTRRLFVRFIPVDCTEAKLREVFGNFGDITEVVLSRDLCRAAKKEPLPWNMAYITYTSTDDATRAIAHSDRQYLLGSTHHLVVKAAENPATKHKRLEWRAQAQASQAPMPPGMVNVGGYYPVNAPPPPPPYGGGPPPPPAYSRPQQVHTAQVFTPQHISPTHALQPQMTAQQAFGAPQQVPAPAGAPPQWTFVQYPPQQSPPHQGAQQPPPMMYRQQPDPYSQPQQQHMMPPPAQHQQAPPGMWQTAPAGNAEWLAAGAGGAPRVVMPQQPQPQQVHYQHQPWNRAPPSPVAHGAVPTHLPTFGAASAHGAGTPYHQDFTHASGHFSVSSNQTTQAPTPHHHHHHQQMMIFESQGSSRQPSQMTSPQAASGVPQQLYIRASDGSFVPVQAMPPQQRAQ